MTYPNVLVLDYLQATGQNSPELRLKAEALVSTGYQRLLSFEVSGGGFSLFGQAPASEFLSAYGLMQLADMSRVQEVDPAVIGRIVTWLLERQQPDGTWQAPDERVGGDRLGATAFVTWALVQAGRGDRPEIARALEAIRRDLEGDVDTYSLALAANALAASAADAPSTGAVLARLADAAQRDGDTAWWSSRGESFLGAANASLAFATTALAVHALLLGDSHPELVRRALAYLVKNKDSFGTWSTTQGTILALRALVLAARRSGEAAAAATVTVRLGDEPARTVTIDQTNHDVVHLLQFGGELAPGRTVPLVISASADANLMVQVTTSYYLPWDQVAQADVGTELVDLTLRYDRTEMTVNDTVGVDLDARLTREGVARMVLLDLGVPPGFSVRTDSLDRLVAGGRIARYQLIGRQLLLYVENFASSAPLHLTYALQARFPMRAKTPPSGAYDYYNPESASLRPPIEITVRQ